MTNQSTIISFLKEQFPTLQGVYLFGSRADGSHREDSDFDIGILLPHGQQLGSLERFDMANALAVRLGADVDLLNLRELYTDVQFQVVAYGERIFCADEYACDTFDMLTISQYQRHQQSIRHIVSDIKNRGYIYERD